MTIIVSFFSSNLYAQSVKINYQGTFGVFGKVGTIYNTIERNSTNYRIESDVKLQGLARVILRGQKEHYVSRGHIENGLMVSDDYTMTTIKKGKKVVKEYHIDHQHKKTYKRYRKWKNGKLVKDEKKDLGFYGKDDLLTLYFNMGQYAHMHPKGSTFTLKAVGLEKQKGIVQISIPSKAQEGKYKKDLGTGTWYAKAKIVHKGFRKKRGDILLSGDTDGYIKKAAIKDILMYGDAKMIRIK